jgi:hypothetical protein
MTREPLPSWLETCGEVAAQLGELLTRLEQPFADMADDEEPEQVRVVACLTEAGPSSSASGRTGCRVA